MAPLDGSQSAAYVFEIVCSAIALVSGGTSTSPGIARDQVEVEQ
jgi:hypothetical protein